jgi:hypothetical protein
LKEVPKVGRKTTCKQVVAQVQKLKQRAIAESWGDAACESIVRDIQAYEVLKLT